MKGSPAPAKRGPKKREREPGPEESEDEDDAETVVDDNERSATPTLQPNQPTSSLVLEKKKKSRSNSPMPPYNKHLTVVAVPSSPSSANEKFVPDADSNSSSSEDLPLSSKNHPTNTKCKVEMLKSGKLLIKTSPDGPPTAPPSSKKSSPSTSEQTATSASTPIKTESAPLSPATPASRPDQDIPVPTAPQPPKAVVIIDKVEAEPINNNTNQKSKENENNNSISKVVTAAVVASDDQQIIRKPVHHQPATRIWLPSKCKLSDKVVITDVTVNLKTVTIRECKTEQGFFKERDLKNVT